MRVLSGIQPSGQLHLGNYFGSIKPNLELTDTSDQSFFFIADLHALTTIHNKETLQQYRRDVILDYLACGFDPEKAIIFNQSDIAEHAELAWILSTLAPMGLLERAVSYKEKIEKGIAASVGLFTYPVLMAADILLYDANLVPVGKDQKQHLEMARDIAIKFNNTFGETLVVPEPLIRDDVAVVPGTDGQKMSKSYDNTIPLFGDEKKTQKAIMGIVTDSRDMTEPKDPETCTIFQIHKLFLTEEEAAALANEYKNGIPYGDAKKKLYETYMDFFGPLREKRNAISESDAAAVLSDGAANAKEVAGGTMEKVKRAVGLGS